MTAAATPGAAAPPATAPAPVIQLRGAAFRNKGAELMLRTVAAEVRRRFPTATITLNYHVGNAGQRRELGAQDLVWMEDHPRPIMRLAHNTLASLAARLASRPLNPPEQPGPARGRLVRVAGSVLRAQFARSTEAVVPDEVDVVLDLSGFAYGDPWGPAKTVISSRYHARVRAAGGAVILLPQQLGPFEDPAVMDAFRDLGAHADLIYARDRLSFQAARRALVDPGVLRQAPDFTTEPGGETPPALAGRACVVPNTKMITHTDPTVAAAYPDFLRRCVAILRARGTRPFILVHDTTGDDLELARSLREAEPELEIVVEPDPFGIKGIIGGALLTVGSRFHGLVNAMSQAVPSLATSWSHKYEALFEEYGCPECIIDVSIPDAELDRAVDRLLSEPHRGRIVAALQHGEEERRRKVDGMWDEVAATIRGAWAGRHG